MTSAERWNLAIHALGVLASVIVAILAIWGDYFRSRFAGPILTLNLVSPDGERTSWTGDVPTRFYHLRVRNDRRWAPGRNVRVVVTRIARVAADQSLAPLPMSGPLQLTWQFPQTSPQYPTIGPDHTCDLGFVVPNQDFSLSPYIVPNNFQETVKPGSRMRAEVQAVADNAESKAVFVEIAWDGVWSEDTAEMRRHLVVKTVSSIDGV